MALAMFLCLAGPGEFERAGQETLDRIEKHYATPSRLVESVDAGGRRSADPAFLWGQGVFGSALAAAARSEPERYVPALDRWLRRIDPYRAGAGYAVWPNQAQPERYYDDNAWVALALVEAYEWTGRDRFLQRAQEVFAFVASGEDEALGGGIWWNEKRESKNTCSVAPAALTALKLGQATGNAAYRAQADRLIRWLEPLRDGDGLYWDHIRTDGGIEKTKWSYNSAVPLRFFALRHRLTGSGSDRAEALRIAVAAERQWLDPEKGAIRDDASFAHHLAEAFLEADALDPAGRWRFKAERATRVAGSLADERGLVGKRWELAPGEAPRLLLYQASLARAQWMLARPGEETE